jgi:signal peptidase I
VADRIYLGRICGRLIMTGNRIKPEFAVAKGSELSLSGPALVELLRAVLGKGAPVRFRAKGFSMSPFIRNEDVVTLSPLQDASPGRGDVIAFVLHGSDKLCVHRVVGKKDDVYTTKGDNSSEADESVTKENILGLVTRVERDGKEVFLGLGPERFLIAFLGGRGLFLPLILPVWKVIRAIVKRSPG